MTESRNERLKRYGKIAGAVVIALVALVALLFAVGVLGIPGFGLEDNQWGEVDDERIEVLTFVWLDNPNPVGGGDADVEYDLELQGVHLAEGEGTGLSAPSGESIHEFRTDLFYGQIPAWWHQHLTNDEVSDVRVDARADVSLAPLLGSQIQRTYEDTISTDIEGALDSGFSEFEGSYSGTQADVRLPDGTTTEPTVDVENVDTRWGEVTEEETEILVTAEIHNPNAYPIPTPAFTGYVGMNEIRVADWDADEVEVLDVEDDALIPPGETEERTFRIVMDNGNVPEWFATHVDRDEQSDVQIAGALALEISGSQVTIPQEGGVTCEFFLTTAIFVDDQENAMDHGGCDVAPLEISDSELEAASAALDLTETDWWDDGLLPGNDDDGDENDDVDDVPDDGDDIVP